MSARPAITTAATVLAVAAALLTFFTLLQPATADARKRSCSAAGIERVTSLRARGTGCSTARTLARRVALIRHDRARYADAPRCDGQFCLRVRRWRCRPTSGVRPAETCRAGRKRVSWVWR